MLNAYFELLQLIENDSSRYMCLKTLQQLLHEPIQQAGGKHSNMDGLLAQPGLLQSLAQSVYDFELIVAKNSGYVFTDCVKVLGHIANFSNSDDNGFNCEDEVAVKFRQEASNTFGRSVDCALEILTQVMVLDL